jgi:Rrf2 family protein
MPTVSKILKLMAGSSLIESHRGVNGGYSLLKGADSVRVSEIIEALEGPIALTACVDGTTDQCTIEGSCPMRGNWNTVNDAIRTALSGVTLADLLDPGEIFPVNSLSKKTNRGPISYQTS